MELGTAAFWLFLAVVIGSLIWRKTLMQREKLVTLRTAIDRGLPLDNSLVQALLNASSEQRSRGKVVSKDFFLVVGAIGIAGALCLAFLAIFVPDGIAFVVVAVCTLIVAATFIVLWRIFVLRAPQDDASSMLS